ncbi:hypothetical protein T09_14253 [Trichinella sp. T9]|nr:hypothetical protein T09_14253 [Trichinella sp. T9]
MHNSRISSTKFLSQLMSVDIMIMCGMCNCWKLLPPGQVYMLTNEFLSR